MKKIQIQLDASATGPAPQSPRDLNTGLPVALWRGEPVAIAASLFSNASTVATVADVTEIKLDISLTADHAAPILTSTATVANTRLDLTITAGSWQDGTDQHAIFPVAKGDLDPDMEGAEQKTLWLRVTMLDDSEWVVLCNGQIAIHEAGPWPV